MPNMSKLDIENSARELIQYVLEIDDDFLSEIEDVPSMLLLKSSFNECFQFCDFTPNNHDDILASAKNQLSKRLQNDSNFDLKDGINDVLYCIEEVFDMDEQVIQASREYLDNKEMSRKHLYDLSEAAEEKIIKKIGDNT